jgi:D-beta-D-heptose 7-phosphate kinase/D-beta-D-heptose 1-phosphate adenosyltransferase
MNTQAQKLFKILLLGDDCLDIYQYGTVDRISPEAPVPVFKKSHEEHKPGMAGNVYQNLKALGLDVQFLRGQTSIKTRLIDSRSKQHIVRVDDDVKSTPITFETAIPPIYDAIVISDYDKGTISYELVEELRKEFSGPIFIDTKKHDLKRFEGCFIKINETEHGRVTSLPEGVPDGLIVTLGSNGAMYNLVKYPVETVEVADVCGAGDTFLASLVYKFLNSKDLSASIKFAIKASAITVQHLGCYAPTLGEING